MQSRLMIPAIAAACLAATAAAAWNPAAAAERLLVQDRDLLVVVDKETACGDPVPITIRSSDSGLFQESSATRLQHTVDGVRAILGFECARTPKLEITGEAGAQDNVVFRGAAGDATQWMVESSERPSAQAAAATSSGPLSMGGSGTEGASFSPAAQQVVAGVSTGMTLDQARKAAAAEFGTTPQFRDGRNIMVAAEGGCDFDFSDGDAPQPGWRCLEAAFTKSEPQLLYALGLSQAVDLDQRDAIVDSLTERFGAPEQSLRGQEPSGQGGGPYVFLSWGKVIADGHAGRLSHLNVPRRVLEAYALARDGITVLTIWQQDPGVMQEAEGPEHRVKL